MKTHKTRVLVIDDDKSAIRLMQKILKPAGFEVIALMDSAEAIQTIESKNPELIILDLMMPNVDGFDILTQARQFSDIPIVIVSGRKDKNDKVKCLNCGADEYIVKPYDVDELIARCNAVLRRYQAINPIAIRSNFTNGRLQIDFALRRISVNGKTLRLTPTESNLLQELVFNAGKTMPYNHLLSKVWGPEYKTEREYVHTYIKRLRSKIEHDHLNPRYIISVTGKGYQFVNNG